MCLSRRTYHGTPRKCDNPCKACLSNTQRVRRLMHDDTLTIPPLDMRPRPVAAEPEIGWQTAPRPLEPTSVAKNQRRMPAALSNSAPVGSLLYLVLAGLVAVATIGVFFGTGFLLLAHPAKETVANSSIRGDAPSLAYGDSLRAIREAQPVRREIPVPNSGALSDPPASAIPQRAAVIEAPPPKQQETPLSPVEDPPVKPASPAATGSSPTTSPVPQTPSAKIPPSPAPDATLPDATKHRSSRSRSHEARSAARHSHSQSAHGAPSPTPHQAGRTRSFDRLVTQLTGQAPPDVPSLTPPQTHQPDPFASPRPGQ